MKIILLLLQGLRSDSVNKPLTKHFRQVLFFSFFINLLVLAPSWYMLEVYDRVINSSNARTLEMLTLMVLLIYVVLEVLEFARSRMMFSMAESLEGQVREQLFDHTFKAKLRGLPGGSMQVFNDLKSVQDAITSPGLTALIDIPFALIALVLIFAISSTLGWFALGGAVLLALVTLLNQSQTQAPLKKATQGSISAQAYVSSVIKNAQVIESMGMLSAIRRRWQEKQNEFLVYQGLASDRAGAGQAISKFLQTLQGSLLLGLGCWLTLTGELPMGGSLIIIGSILGGRVLSPLVLVATFWRPMLSAQDALSRLEKMAALFPTPMPTMDLPAPQGHVTAESIVASAPNSQVAILKGVSFKLPAGESLAVIGPSASGKTTLARLLTGVWPAANGKLRLDGADVYTWNKEELGRHVGYLPQNVELFDGTIAENISRFGDVDTKAVEEAVSTVGLAGFIGSLQDGVDTEIGEDGAFLSGGQRQLVALARAIYKRPKLIVLDEPNSNLDEAGDQSLVNTIQAIQAFGATLVIISHRPQVLSVIKSTMVLVDGQVKAFGPTKEVIEKLQQGAKAATQAPQGYQGVP
jgi:ATP-binding cassette subfamily C exporter for protease/lipase